MTLIISASQQGRQTHRVKTNLRCSPLFPLVPPTVTDTLMTGTSFQSPPPSTSPLKDYGERLFLQLMGLALPFSYWKFSVVVVSLTWFLMLCRLLCLFLNVDECDVRGKAVVTVLWRGWYSMLGYHHQPDWGPQRGTLEGTSCQSIWQLPRRGLPWGSCYSPVSPTMRLLSLHTTSSIQNADIVLTSEMPIFFFAYFKIRALHRESKRDGVKEGWRVCRGGLFLGLTFGHARRLSQLRPEDSITLCLRLCPSLQGAVLRA